MTRDSASDEEPGAGETASDGSGPTALLSPNHREFLRGQKDDVANPRQYENNIRHRANNRVEQIAADLSLLERTGHEDIVAQFYYQVNRIERLKSECDWRGDSPSSASEK